MIEVKIVSPFRYIHFYFLTNILISGAASNLLRFPGNNPVQAEGELAIILHGFIAPVWTLPSTATGQIVAGQINFVAAPTISSTPTPPST